MNKKMKTEQSKSAKQPQFKYARSFVTLVVGLVFLSGVAVFASKGGGSLLSFMRPVVKVDLSGTVSRDSGKVELSKAGAVKPGEILDWKIVSQNDGEGKASGYKAVGQIPAGTKFVAGSANAEGKVVVEYSIDGGQNFSEKPMIKAKQADGSEKLVVAPASLYTQVRFDWEKPLNSGEKLAASYSTRVE